MNNILKFVVVIIISFVPLNSWADDSEALKNALNNDTCKKLRKNTAAIVGMRNDGMPQDMASEIFSAGVPDTDPTKIHLPVIAKNVYKFGTLNIHSHSMYQFLGCARKLEGKSIKPLEEYNNDLLICQGLSEVNAQISCIAGVIDN